ncbi:MAG: PEP-CTERM sorting domain-containing protein [Rubrivivax sp.]|nr:PEP-CTERM sorting domain-containing protein [Rubrivivax sp.]
MHADAAGTFWAGASTSFIPADYGPQTVATAHEAVVNMTLRYGFQKFADDARLTIDIAGADFGGIDGNLHESFFFAGFDLDVILSRFGPNVTPQTTVLSHRAAVWSILQPAGAFKLGDNQGDLEDSVHFEPLCGYSPSVHCNAGERQVGGIGFLDALSRDIDLGDIEVGEAFAIRYELKVWAYAPGGESVSWSYFRDPLAGDGSPDAAGGASFTHSGLRAARVPVDDIVVGGPSTVPEPTTAALLLLAVAAAGASERRQRRPRRPC